MTSDEIDAQIVEKTKAIIQAQTTLDTIQNEQYQLRKKLLEVTESVRQAKLIVAIMKSEREILTREFWRVKNG